MNISTGQITLLATEWIYGYAIFRLLRVFFPRETCKNKVVEIISYIAFMVINSICYMLFFIPLVVAACSTIQLFLLTYNYRGKVKQRILAVIVCMFGMSTAEALGASILIKLPDFMGYYVCNDGIWGPIMSRLISFMVVLIIEKLDNIRNGAKVPWFYWANIFFVSIIGITELALVSGGNLKPEYVPMICICVFLNMMLFFVLYDRLILMYEKSEKAMIIDMENNSYRKQLEIMQDYMTATKTFRHDLKNHILTIQGLMDSNRNEEALSYIKEASNIYETKTNYVNSGNIELDSLLNYKICQAEKYGIQMKVGLTVPENNVINSSDLTVIVGNLIDNAMDALQKLSIEERIFDLDIRYSKGRLLIYMQNPYRGELHANNNKFETTKKDKTRHGIGLQSIDIIIQKYHGEMSITTEEKQFIVNIILYTD